MLPGPHLRALDDAGQRHVLAGQQIVWTAAQGLLQGEAKLGTVHPISDGAPDCFAFRV